jgi:iron complex transport system substrate-binding protein
VALVAAFCAAGAAVADAPARVVSLNICTDQLAMLLAAPGQLVAVSHLASDPMSSVMAEEARDYRATRGQAEDVFLLRSDLVLAGTYTTRATVAMLQRLGVRVEVFPPPFSLADIPAQMRAVGAVLGRAEAGERMAAEFEAGLAALRVGAGDRPRAALYSASGYTGGARSLSGEILEAAGFANIAAELGLPEGGWLPLEQLILAEPETVIAGGAYPGHSRAEELLDHPALARLRRGAVMRDAEWICPVPEVLDAIARLGAERRALRP